MHRKLLLILKKCRNPHQHNYIRARYRDTRRHILWFNVTIAGLQDVPQMLFIAMVVSILGFSVIGAISFVMSLLMTIISIGLCLTANTLIGMPVQGTRAATQMSDLHQHQQIQKVYRMDNHDPNYNHGNFDYHD